MNECDIDGKSCPSLLIILQETISTVSRRAVKRTTSDNKQLSIVCNFDNNVVVEDVKSVVKRTYSEGGRPM